MAEFINVRAVSSDRGRYGAATVVTGRGSNRKATRIASGEDRDFVVASGREIIVVRTGPTKVVVKNDTSADLVTETFEVDPESSVTDIDVSSGASILDDVLRRGRAESVPRGSALKIVG